MTTAPLVFHHKQQFGYASVVRRSGAETANVPCGTCVECCRNTSFDVDLASHEDPAQYQCHYVEKRDWHVLDRQADGSCVYLVDGRCSIYKRRPRACRSFDCRQWVAAKLRIADERGVEEGWSKAAHEKFEVVVKTPEDEIAAEVVALARDFVVGQSGGANGIVVCGLVMATAREVMKHPTRLGVILSRAKQTLREYERRYDAA